MLLTITLIITALVIFNLLLLKLSCNKTVKTQKVDKKPVVLRTRLTVTSYTQALGATGS
ncbi:hypothetical protein [Algibacter pectinivorans]|uniref:Uncharacterized protein n=1 Tax=Algibacter pectinivorans TaxID=870482 RepID=A0A1I1P908_9FLAO|nr:hypothetical protein [Algibacter pectinivorans]SFD06307.1 hypothetical protein SAMN04487987_103299 [Algibacter pectinivorans]